jgi:peptidoglycan/LPS O-acetylase OafA/YrhL
VLPAVSTAWREVLPSLVPSQAGLWTYTANLSLAQPSLKIFGHMWSLMVEEHFYLVWPTLVWFASPRGMARLCVGAVLASAALRFFLLSRGITPEAVYVFTPARLDGLALGALIAVLLQRRAIDARVMRVAGWAVVGAAVLLLPVAAHDTALFLYGAWVQRFGYTLLAVLFAGVLVRVLGAPRTSLLSRFFSSRPMAVFGKYSYGAYVYHLFLVELLFEPLGTRERVDAVVGHDLGMLVYLVIGVVASYAVAALSYEAFEERFLRMKRYFEYGPRPTNEEMIPCPPTSTTSR